MRMPVAISRRSRVQTRPLFYFDSRDQRCSTLAVRMEYERLAIRHAGRLRKSAADVRHVGDADCVRSLCRLGHSFFQPGRLSFSPTLHALAVIAQFGGWLRIG